MQALAMWQIGSLSLMLMLAPQTSASLCSTPDESIGLIRQSIGCAKSGLAGTLKAAPQNKNAGNNYQKG